MPSDARIVPALEALRAPIAALQSAVAAALAQVADHLDAHRAPVGASVAAASLGAFAAGRLDTDRFAATFRGARVLDATDASRLERCRTTLAELLVAADEPHVIELASGADLEQAVGAAFARVGRAFGAAVVFQAVRAGGYREESHARMLEGLPFEQWNAAERLLAPPLVVSVDAADLDAARLARFLDGRVRLVLLVRGTPAPAALVPLLTPGTLVVQTSDVASLARVAAARTPAVLALVPTSCACFLHDPAAGPRLADRLTIEALPDEPPRKAVGRLSAAQQGEQLAQLRALGAAAQAERAQDADRVIDTVQRAAVAAGRTDVPAVDVLAGWLLAQAGMTDARAAETDR